ncbi:MAG TPA: TetR/AcrR family transcriptional regulator [Acidimicrobiales bacterium]
MQRAQTTDEARPSAKWLARREAIVDTSARVFARVGYHGTGITELCAANGLGKGALYHYIGSKEALLAAIHDRVMDEVLQAAARVRLSGAPPSSRLAMLGEEQLGIIGRYPDHVWVFLHDFHALTGERAQEFRRRRHEFEQAVEEIILDGTAAGEFRDAEPRLTALAWLGMYNWAYLWLHGNGPLSAHDVAKPFAEIFLRGITRTAPVSP